MFYFLFTFCSLFSLAYSQSSGLCWVRDEIDNPENLLETEKMNLMGTNNDQTPLAYAWLPKKRDNDDFVPAYSSVPKPDAETGMPQNAYIRMQNPLDVPIFVKIRCDHDQIFNFQCNSKAENSGFRLDGGDVKCVEVIQVWFAFLNP